MIYSIGTMGTPQYLLMVIIYTLIRGTSLNISIVNFSHVFEVTLNRVPSCHSNNTCGRCLRRKLSFLQWIYETESYIRRTVMRSNTYIYIIVAIWKKYEDKSHLISTINVNEIIFLSYCKRHMIKKNWWIGAIIKPYDNFALLSVQ